MTGTPLPAKLDDLHGLLAFLKCEPFCGPHAWKAGIVKPIEAAQEHGRDALVALMKRLCMRHTQADVALPPRTTSFVRVPLSRVEAEAYARLASARLRPSFAAWVAKGGHGARCVNALRAAACGTPPLRISWSDILLGGGGAPAAKRARR